MLVLCLTRRVIRKKPESTWMCDYVRISPLFLFSILQALVQFGHAASWSSLLQQKHTNQDPRTQVRSSQVKGLLTVATCFSAVVVPYMVLLWLLTRSAGGHPVVSVYSARKFLRCICCSLVCLWEWCMHAGSSTKSVVSMPCMYTGIVCMVVRPLKQAGHAHMYKPSWSNLSQAELFVLEWNTE